jgi:hypothetical protein
MSRTLQRLAPIAIGSATLVLALSCAMHQRWSLAALAVVAGAAWLAGHLREWRLSSALAPVVLVGLAAVGSISGVNSLALLIGAVLVLVAWSLDRFTRHLHGTGESPAETELARTHLRHLLAVAAAGLLLGGIGLAARLDLGFVPALVLGGIGIAGVGRLLVLQWRESRERSV